MNKIYIYLLTFFSVAYGYLPNKDILLEANAAYIFPLRRTFQRIYTNAGYYRLEGTLNTKKYVKPWTSLGIIYTSGTSIGEDDSTSLYMIPLDIGIKLIYPINKFYPYISGGLELAWSYIQNNSIYVQKNQFSLDVGATTKIGTYINPHTSSFFLNLFCEYTWLNGNFPKPPAYLNISTNTADLSRLSLGGGIGFSF